MMPPTLLAPDTKPRTAHLPEGTRRKPTSPAKSPQNAPSVPALGADGSYPIFTLGDAITPEQQVFFDNYGFIHFRRALPTDVVTHIKDRLDGCCRGRAD